MKVLVLLLLLCVACVHARTVYDDEPFDSLRDVIRGEPIRQVASLINDFGRQMIDLGRYDSCKCPDGRLPVCDEYSSFCRCANGVRLRCRPDMIQAIVHEQFLERRRNEPSSRNEVVCRLSSGACDIPENVEVARRREAEPCDFDSGKPCNGASTVCPSDAYPLKEEVKRTVEAKVQDPAETYVGKAPLPTGPEKVLKRVGPDGKYAWVEDHTRESRDKVESPHTPPVGCDLNDQCLGEVKSEDVPSIGGCDPAEYCLGNVQSKQDQKLAMEAHFDCNRYVNGCPDSELCSWDIKTFVNDYHKNLCVKTRIEWAETKIRMLIGVAFIAVVGFVTLLCHALFKRASPTPPTTPRRQRRTERRRERRTQQRALRPIAVEGEVDTDLSTLFPEEEESSKVESDPRPEKQSPEDEK